MKIKTKIKDWQQKANITKPMRNMLIFMGALLGLILMYHLISGTIKKLNLEEEAQAPITVATVKVEYQDWQKTLTAIGNLFPGDGIQVTPLVDGLIREIYVKSNQQVKKGDKLIQLNAEPDVAALAALQAQAKLARLIYERDLVQFAFNAISKEDLEIDEYNMHVLDAQVEQQKALVELKTVRAAFDGIIGVVKLSPGQLIQEGTPLFSLNSLADLSVYFYLPEQYTPQLAVGQDVKLHTDNYPNLAFPGKILAIDPLIDSNTHNVQLESSIENDQLQLYPGMYAEIEIIIGKPSKHLTIPQAAVSYNPYGNYVYIVLKNDDDDDERKKNDGLYVKQRFVTLGETRGDQVEITKGLKEGDEIVSAGQLKLRNNAPVMINNQIQPSNNPNPKVVNES